MVRGSEGTAVTTVAYSLIGLVIHGAIFNQHFPFHLNYGSNTTRELLWPIAMAGQALARNSKLLHTSNGFANAGPMTEMLFRETAVPCHGVHGNRLAFVGDGLDPNKYKNGPHVEALIVLKWVMPWPVRHCPGPR